MTKWQFDPWKCVVWVGVLTYLCGGFAFMIYGVVSLFDVVAYGTTVTCP